MISIIISKYNPALIENVSENIKNTIGVPIEIIIIENGRGEKGLCEVYNEGAQKARYEILCFSHEDVEMQTMNWGSVVCNAFNQNQHLGLLGVAGSSYKPLSPSGWWYENAHPSVVITNYIQSDRSRQRCELINNNPRNENLSEVVCVDGFWFCTRKTIALSLKFDELTFKGFHCYDIDYSLSVFQQYEVCVCFTILIKHYSEGNESREWVRETLKLTNKWKTVLPLHSRVFKGESRRREELVAFRYFLKQMLVLAFPLTKIFILPWSMKSLSLIGLNGAIALLTKSTFDLYLKLKFTLLKRFRHVKGI